jgi:hypothetical protein
MVSSFVFSYISKKKGNDNDDMFNSNLFLGKEQEDARGETKLRSDEANDKSK